MKTMKESKPAKICFEHIGGKLGMLLMDTFIEKNWIAKDNPKDKHYYITDKGQKEFTKMGIDLSQIESERL
jgi:DNA-binding PadR family transcriptional regulator